MGWKPNPSPEHVSQLLGWKDLGLRKIKADDSHFGDRFGRTVVLHGNHLIVGADYATCRDSTSSPGGVCEAPGKGAVYIYEMDYVTAPYYRWDASTVHGGGTGTWGGYPTSNSDHSHCDDDGENCVLATGLAPLHTQKRARALDRAHILDQWHMIASNQAFSSSSMRLSS